MLTLKETEMSTVMEDNIKRWTAKRKTALALGIIQDKTTESESGRTYDLNPSKVSKGAIRAKMARRTHCEPKPNPTTTDA